MQNDSANATGLPDNQRLKCALDDLTTCHKAMEKFCHAMDADGHEYGDVLLYFSRRMFWHLLEVHDAGLGTNKVEGFFGKAA